MRTVNGLVYQQGLYKRGYCMIEPYVNRDSVGNTSASIQFSTMFSKTVFAFAVLLLVAVTAGPLKDTTPMERKHFKNYLKVN